MLFDIIGILPALHKRFIDMLKSQDEPTSPDLQTDLQRAVIAKENLERQIRDLITCYEREFGLKVIEITHVRTSTGYGILLHHRIGLTVTI